MIYPYIKVNPKVADYLELTSQRGMLPDGNYLLWKHDLISLGGNNEETLARIGAVGMDGRQARDEQKGKSCTPLPIATDERFRMEPAEIEENVEQEPVAEEGDSNE